MKNIRIRVVENCGGTWWWYAICKGKGQLIRGNFYSYKANVVKAAKAISKRIGIKYDPEIIKMHGC